MLDDRAENCALVEDNGVGIPMNQQAKIFQPFQRAGQETGPMFWIELTLPRTASLIPERVMAIEPALDQLRNTSEPRVTIVYIEDNPSNVAFMEEFFADYGRIDLVSAPSAEIGLALIRELRPRVVIMDLNLPGMNGVDASTNSRSGRRRATFL